MIVKIKKSTYKRIWYKNLIGHEFEVNDQPSNEYKNTIVLNCTHLYGRYILIGDTNYYTKIRKEKLKKINESR
jgi:hypothetical protein